MRRTMHETQANQAARRMPLTPRKIANNALAILLALSMVWWQTPIYAIADDDATAQQPAAVVEEQPSATEIVEAPAPEQPEVVSEETSEPVAPEIVGVEEPAASAVNGEEEAQSGTEAAAGQPQGEQVQLTDQGAPADEQVGEPFALRDLTEAVFVDEQKIEAATEDFAVTPDEKHDFWIVFKEKDGKQLPEEGKLSYKLPTALAVAAVDVKGMAVLAPESANVARGTKANVTFELKNGDELVMTLAENDSVYAGAIGSDDATIAVRFKAEVTRDCNLSDFGGTVQRSIVVRAETDQSETLEDTVAKRLSAMKKNVGVADQQEAPEYPTDMLELSIDWTDWDNAYGQRPDEVKVIATTTGVVSMTKEYTITADDNWWIPVEVPKAPASTTVFSFDTGDQEFAASYNISSRKTHSKAEVAVALPASMKYVSYAVVQNWTDQSNAAGLRPATSGITVYMDGEPFPIPECGLSKSMSSGTVPTIFSWPYKVATPSSSTTTTTTIYLPALVHEDGTPAIYTASQDPISYYDTTSVVKDARQTRITNTFKETTSFTVNMSWENDVAREQQRPSTVFLTLLANGEPYQGKDSIVELSSTSSKRTWNNLPANDPEGNPVVYSVTQNQLTIYDTSYEETTVDEQGAQSMILHNSRRDDWNYAIDLKWDTPDPAQKYHQEMTTLYSTPVTVKYNLNISTNSRAYEPGEFEVRLPYYLWRGRNGDYIGPSAVSVPKAPEHNSGYAFNYTIDTHGTSSKADDEIVFVNWTHLPTATNITLPVAYEIKPRNTTDLSVAHLVATGHAKGDGQTDYEVQESAEITYRMDTGVTITAAKKESAKAVYGDWRTGSDMQYGVRVIADDTCDHEKYDYVMYDIHAEIAGNQPYKMSYTEQPGDGGEIVAYRYVNGNYLKFTFDEASYTWTAESKNIARNQYMFDVNSTDYRLLGGNPYDYTIRVLVRYPRNNDNVKPVAAGGQSMYLNRYHNTFIATAEAVDDVHEPDEWGPDRQDLSTKSAQVSFDYRDYLFNWDGDTYRFTKSMNELKDYGVTRIENGEDLEWNGSLTNIVNGYKFGTFGEESYQYKEELYDEDIYWNVTDAKGGGNFQDYKRLTSDDYYFNYVCAQVNLDDINRKTGEQYADADYQNEEFEIQARTQGGEWTVVKKFTLGKGSSQWYRNNSDTNVTFGADQQIVGVRIVSPDSLRGRTHIYFNFGITIKANSPVAQELAKMEEEGKEFDKLYLMNIGSMKLYRNDGKGNYNWVNPVAPGNAASQCDAAAGVGLSEEDLTNPDNGGNCVEHKYYTRQTGRTSYTDYAGKRTVSVVNDNVNSKVDVTFVIGAAEHIGLSSLPDSVYKEMSFDEGMFYDLLPRGYTYTEGSAVAHGAGQSFNASNNTAQVVKVETVDNYEGTGRQLVKFSVASGREEGTNIALSIGDIGMGNYYGIERKLTGFAVSYKASITWEALTYNRIGYNMVAYYDGADGLGREFKGSNSTPRSDANGYNINTSNYFDGAQLVDANGNGTDRDHEVMYAYSYVNPQILVPIETGISKTVRGVTGTFSKHDFTTIGGTYDYRIALHTSDNGKTGDIVLYDVLEEAANTGGHYNEQSWKGVLSSVDTSVPASQGIAPVVYYSTLEGIDYNDINDTDRNLTVDNSEVWSTVPPEDMSKVTAIAVDLRKDKNGKAFTFDSNSSTNITLTMLAPTELPEPRFAYNRPAYHATYTPYGSIPDPDRVYLNIGTRVSVELFTVDVNKKWIDRDNLSGLRADSVTVHVLADGVDTGRTVELSEQNDWHYKFTDLPAITQKGETITYTVEEDPVEGYETEITGNATDGFTIVNSRASAEMYFSKHYSGGAADGKEFKFELAACDSEGTLLEGDDAYSTVVTNDKFVDGVASVHFSTLFVDDGDYYYRVWELDPEGTTVGDQAAYLVHVKVEGHVASDPEYTSLYPDASGTYQVVEKDIKDPAFYNNERTTRHMVLRARPMALTGYTADAERTSVYPQVEKVLDSPMGILVGGDYSFDLLDAEGTVIATASNDENGHVAFYKEDAGELGLVFDAPGTHEYTIRERIPEGAHDNGDGTFTLDETIYDGSTITLKVDVTEADGALAATCTYTNAEGLVLETPTFTNVQEGMDLVVYKVSRYGGEGLDKCTYALWMVGPNGDVMLREGTSDTTGRIVFKDVVMSSANTYYFKEVEAPAGHTVDPYRTAYFTLNEEGTGTVLIEETADDGWHSKYDNIWIDQEKRAAEADAAAAAAGGAAGSTGLGDDAGAVSRDATPIKEG